MSATAARIRGPFTRRESGKWCLPGMHDICSAFYAARGVNTRPAIAAARCRQLRTRRVLFQARFGTRSAAMRLSLAVSLVPRRCEPLVEGLVWIPTTLAYGSGHHRGRSVGIDGVALNPRPVASEPGASLSTGDAALSGPATDRSMKPLRQRGPRVRGTDRLTNGSYSARACSLPGWCLK
jgi:hypothetical protein